MNRFLTENRFYYFCVDGDGNGNSSFSFYRHSFQNKSKVEVDGLGEPLQSFDDKRNCGFHEWEYKFEYQLAFLCYQTKRHGRR